MVRIAERPSRRRERRLYLLFMTDLFFLDCPKLKSDFNFREGRIVQDEENDKGQSRLFPFYEGGEKGNR
jgi:hypothetical protein